jgi:hypothetical protein
VTAPGALVALSIQQPWAWLIVRGFKPVENRTWPTQYRGPLLIHAGQKFDHDGAAWVRERFPDVPLPGVTSYERGGIVGRVRLATCVPFHASDWFVGPWGFVLADPEPLPFVACRGMLGLFSVDVQLGDTIDRDTLTDAARR